jgi:hypothetical protein
VEDLTFNDKYKLQIPIAEKVVGICHFPEGFKNFRI